MAESGPLHPMLAPLASTATSPAPGQSLWICACGILQNPSVLAPGPHSFSAPHCLPKTRMENQEPSNALLKSSFVKNSVSHQPTPLTQSSGCGLMRDTVLARVECRLPGRPDLQPSGGWGGTREGGQSVSPKRPTLISSSHQLCDVE